MSESKRVLVLGGNGMVGNALKEIKKDDPNWIFILGRDEADLTNAKETSDLFENYQPSHVINLAAYVGGLYKNMREPVEFFVNNILINMNVMKCCYEYGVDKLISVMSTCIFPDDITYPITEEKLHLGPPHSSNEGYSYAKRMIDVLSRSYNNEYGTKFITVIPGNLYGRFDNFNLDDCHVVPALIKKCAIAKKSGEPWIINGSGKPLRQFTFSPDLAKLLVWALDNYEDNSPLILSSEEELSISDVADHIKNSMKYEGKIEYDTSKSDGQYKKTISNDKLQSLYPFKFVKFEEGIKETVDWFLKYYKDD